MSTSGHRRRRGLLPHRLVWSRPRLFSSAALGLACAAVLYGATTWRAVTRLLVGWDVAVAVYLALVLEMMARSNVSDIRVRAAREDAGQLTILILTVAAGVASLGAILVHLTGTGGERSAAQIGLVVATILLSWAFIHVMFALHYAHEFYGENEGPAGGLTFPGGDPTPDYWDFVYFAFTIGMTAETSDVSITSKGIRRTALAHGIVSFVFNVALLALTINVAAGILGGPG
jgi:uncharacterized membrane protein